MDVKHSTAEPNLTFDLRGRLFWKDCYIGTVGSLACLEGAFGVELCRRVADKCRSLEDQGINVNRESVTGKVD